MATSVPTPAAAYVRPSLRAAALSLSDLPRRFGRYVLLRRIAKGGMGEVMLATTLGLEGAERPLIIKTIRTEHRTDKSFKARFLDEARVQAQLEHAGVCQVLEATTDDDSGEPYVVVEFVDGRSLGDVRARALTSGQRIEWHEAVAIAELAAEALAHVHERHDAQNRPLNIVHRDLSPQNLMIGYGGEVKIIDFGTARGENRRCHTVSGVVFAKPGYVAPEVANGNPGDFRVDLYALGVMLWELCAGRRFLEGEASDHMAAVSKNLRNLPPIAEVAGAPRALDEVDAAASKAMTEIEAVMKKLGLHQTGPRTVVTTEWGDENYVFDVVVPVDASVIKIDGKDYTIGPAQPPSLEQQAADEAAGSTVERKPGEMDKHGNLVVSGNVRARTGYSGKALFTTWVGSPAGLPLMRLTLKAYAASNGFHFNDNVNHYYDEMLTDPAKTPDDEQQFVVYLPVTDQVAATGTPPQQPLQQAAGMQR